MFRESLKGKTALVTGASSGLGRHFAEVLSAQGARVVLAARTVKSLESACADIANSGGHAETMAMDVTDAESVKAAFSRTSDIFDIVINNAGISGAAAALDLDTAQWDRVIGTNLTGVFTVSQCAARLLCDEKRPGSIINIASILGIRVAGQVAAYAASKAAVIQLSRALALEWARYGIRVNTLCPGYFQTPFNQDFFSSEAGEALVKRIPQRRLGRLEELDAPLLLLCSDAGSYMTGSEIVIDGGHLVSSL